MYCVLCVQRKNRTWNNDKSVSHSRLPVRVPSHKQRFFIGKNAFFFAQKRYFCPSSLSITCHISFGIDIGYIELDQITSNFYHDRVVAFSKILERTRYFFPPPHFSPIDWYYQAKIALLLLLNSLREARW